MVGSAIRGGYAEYIVVPATSVFPIPASVSYVQAASLPTVFMPSWNILIRRAELQPWEIALVPSASSGVGTAAIQVAKKTQIIKNGVRVGVILETFWLLSCIH